MTAVRRVVLAANGLAPAEGASPFFTHAYWDLETTKTTFKNNIVLRTHLEHSESWQFEDRQMGAGELMRLSRSDQVG